MTKTKKRKTRRQKIARQRRPKPPASPGRVERKRTGRPSGSYRGMLKNEWTSWPQVTETFAAERPMPHADLQRAVLHHVLPSSWGELVAGGWVSHAGLRAYEQNFPGFGDRRVYQLIERFTRWLHDRGDIDAWTRDVLYTAIDDARHACGHPRKRDRRVQEMTMNRLTYARELEAFTGTLEVELQRLLAPCVITALVLAVMRQIGPSDRIPLGAIDPEAFAADVMLAPEDTLCEPPDVQDALFVAAAFYRWAGETERLDPQRAAHLANRFSEAALRFGRKGSTSSIAC